MTLGSFSLGEAALGETPTGAVAPVGVTGSIDVVVDDDTTISNAVLRVKASSLLLEGNDTSTSIGVVGGIFQAAWASNCNILIKAT